METTDAMVRMTVPGCQIETRPTAEAQGAHGRFGDSGVRQCGERGKRENQRRQVARGAGEKRNAGYAAIGDGIRRKRRAAPRSLHLLRFGV